MTVTPRALPATLLPVEATTASRLAANALTLMPPWVPLIELVTVSVAVIYWLPAVRRVALKVPLPLVKVVLAGRLAWLSELVKWSVPA